MERQRQEEEEEEKMVLARLEAHDQDAEDAREEALEEQRCHRIVTNRLERIGVKEEELPTGAVDGAIRAIASARRGEQRRPHALACHPQPPPASQSMVLAAAAAWWHAPSSGATIQAARTYDPKAGRGGRDFLRALAPSLRRFQPASSTRRAAAPRHRPEYRRFTAMHAVYEYI